MPLGTVTTDSGTGLLWTLSSTSFLIGEEQ